MLDYKAIVQVEVDCEGSEFNYSFTFYKPINIKANNQEEAQNIALNQIDKMSRSPNKSAILERIISE